jgi:hypothetical protein
LVSSSRFVCHGGVVRGMWVFFLLLGCMREVMCVVIKV